MRLRSILPFQATALVALAACGTSHSSPPTDTTVSTTSAPQAPGSGGTPASSNPSAPSPDQPPAASGPGTAGPATPAGNPSGSPTGSPAASPTPAPGPATTAQQPVWQLQPSGVVFDGHVDTDGNLYWRECGTASSQGPDCSVVSVDRDGRPRWHRNVGVTYGAPILVEGKLVLIAQNQPADACAQALLQARSTVDGGVLWSRDLVALMGAQTFPNQCPAFLGTVPAAGPRPGTVVAGADAFTPWLTTVGTYARYFTISLADGTALEVSAIQTTSPGGGPAIHLDEAGNAYSDNILHTLSRSPGGTVRWDVIRDYVGFVTAAWSGTVVLTGLDGLALMRGADGSTFAQVADSGPPVLDATGVTWIAMRAGHATAIDVDPATGAERWSHPLDPGAEFVSGDSTHTLFFTELVATNAGTHLVVTQRATSTGAKAQLVRTYEAPVVRELDRDGNEVAATPLAGSGALGERIALRDGRLTLYFLDGSTVNLRTYDVPGRTIASSGWASEFGNMERNLHAQ